MKTGRYYYKPQLIGDGSPSLSRGTPAAVADPGTCSVASGAQQHFSSRLDLCGAAPRGDGSRGNGARSRDGARGKHLGCTLFVFLPATGKRSLFIQEASFALFVKCHMVAVFHVFKKKKKIGIQQYLFKVYLVIHIIKNIVNLHN